MNRPRLCGKHKKAYNIRKREFSNRLTSLFGRCQFCFGLDALVVIEKDIINPMNYPYNQRLWDTTNELPIIPTNPGKLQRTRE